MTKIKKKCNISIMQNYDVYVILNHSDWDSAKKNIPYIKKNLGAENVIIVSSPELLKQDICGCSFLDENKVFEGLSYSSVKEYLTQLDSITKNTGWYLQQFLKFAISYICKNEYYLVWDADTAPLNKLNFFDKKGRPYFNLKREYFTSYFRTIKNLFGVSKKTKESFISEHMLFNVQYLKELLKNIEENKNLKGENFWQKILNASDLHGWDFIKKDQRFFSEFETYGTYMDNFYPDVYSKRKLRTLRYGTDFLGANPSEAVIEWAAKDFDTISFEAWGNPLKEFTSFVEDSEFRKKYSFANALRYLFKIERKKIYKDFPKINHEQFEYYNKKLLNKTKFDFFFGKTISNSTKPLRFKQPWYEKISFLSKNINRIKRYWKLMTFKF